MIRWGWTCEACGQTGVIEGTDDLLENSGTRHQSGHAESAFDEVPRLRLSEVTDHQNGDQS